MKFTDGMYHYYKVSYRSWLALAHFANAAEEIGLETTGIRKIESGGLVLELSSGQYNYEVRMDEMNMMLGRSGLDGVRVKLFDGSTGTRFQFSAMLEAVRRSEQPKQGVMRWL